MKAIILAAGRGSRMQGLTEARPKCLIEIGGRPLVEWQLRALRAAGAEQVSLVRGYRGELLTPYGDRHFENPRWSETNMVGSLACAAGWLRTSPCVVSYSDIFYSTATVAALATTDAALAITFDPDWKALWSARFDDPLSDAETFRIDATGAITEIGGKTRVIDDIQGQYMGLLRFTPASWREVEAALDAMGPERRDRLDMTGLLGVLIGRGVRVQGIATPGAWGEADNADDVAFYAAEIAAGRLDLAVLTQGASQ
jgi:L-glutamine-phosphate cytidylyltransferase